jgi:hypothetical protein
MKKMTTNYPIVLIQCHGAEYYFASCNFFFLSIFCSEIKCEKEKNKIEQIYKRNNRTPIVPLTSILTFLYVYFKFMFISLFCWLLILLLVDAGSRPYWIDHRRNMENMWEKKYSLESENNNMIHHSLNQLYFLFLMKSNVLKIF